VREVSWVGLFALLAGTGCVSELMSTPCSTDAECSSTQRCVDNRCASGGSAAGGGAAGGGAAGGGAAGGGAAGGGAAGGGAAGGGAAGGGAASDGGLQASVEVLSASGRMEAGSLVLDVRLGDPIRSTTMAGGPWELTTSVSLRRSP
jgi:hypothetical protein